MNTIAVRRASICVVSISVLFAPAVRAQPPAQAPGQAAPAAASAAVQPDLSSANVIELGLRGTAFTSGSDTARFQRYRDLRNGPTIDLVNYGRLGDTSGFTVHAEHVGYRDQRYEVDYNRYGKLKMSFTWDQIPLFFSRDTATLFSFADAGTLRIDDAIQQGIQNKTLTLASAVSQARRFDLRFRRDIFNFNLVYSATPHLDLSLLLKNTTKDGNQPWAGTFGFGNAVELPVPIDTRTTDVGTALEWASPRGMARVAYDGSFFRNSISTLVWDNPSQLTDTTAAPSQGRESLWPDSSLNAVSANGLVNLPGHSRATAYLSVGNWSQDNPLIPFTINSALPVIPLDRATSDAQATVTAQTYMFTSRPTPQWWFTARFRSYNFDNKTPVFHVTNTVAYDTSVAAFGEGGTSPYSIDRKTFDAEASYTPWRYAAFRAGYTREGIDQTFRSFDTTTEHTGRFSADLVGVSWLTVRAVYEHGKRVGSGFDEQALDDIGEQISLRQFDISNRTMDRFSTIVQATPVGWLTFTGTASAGREDRPESVFGLRSNDNRSFSIGADYTPRDAVSMGISYGHERYDTKQASRQANPGPQFDDPTRDWTTSGADRADTVSASMDLLKLFSKTDVRFAYDYSHATSTYVYGLAPNSTLAPVVQLPPVVNTFNRLTLEATRRLRPHWTVGGSYWLDKYSVDDFALNPSTLNTLAQPSFLILGYMYRPYTASTLMARVGYIW
jgi:MtrB/PioB family decaheme-associated outer membrane protein